MSWQAATWAMTNAPMPKNDPPARAVLAYLAVKADGRGRNAYPINASIAHDVGMNPEVVPRVLKRLVSYGLISKDGVGPQGQPKWTLHMERHWSVGSFDAFVRRYQSDRTLRQSRYRSRLVDDDESSTCDDDESSTGTPVDDDESSCRRLSIVNVTTMSRFVDDSESPQKSPLEKSTSVLDQSTVAAATATPNTNPPHGTKPDTNGAVAKRDLNEGRDDVERLCQHLADRIESNGSARPSITKGWRDAARLLLDRDGRTEQQVHNAIDWCQDDSFWCGNVLSMPTLRAQYDRLRLQAQRASTPTRRASTTDQRVDAAQALKARYAADPRNRPDRRQLPGGRPA